jgi:hypothetical protein
MLWYLIQEPILLLDNYWYSNLSHDTLDTTPNILLYSNWYSNLYVMILLIQQPILLLCITRYSNSYVMTLLIQQQRNHYIYTLDTTNSWYSNLKYDTWYNNQYIITHQMIQQSLCYETWYSNPLLYTPKDTATVMLQCYWHNNLIYYYTPIESAISMLRYSWYNLSQYYTWTKVTDHPLLEAPHRCAYQKRLEERQAN